MNICLASLLTAAAFTLVFPSRTAQAAAVVETLDVAPVWSAHPVGFCLLTGGGKQFVAFYDAERRMTVAERSLKSRKWTLHVLPETLGWDSHNYVTMAADRDGYLHLSGNMHGHPLKYFRTEKPWDASTFERVEAMVGAREARCTYPSFLLGKHDEMVFTYRDGGSGNGDQIYNIYDTKTRAWKRLIDKPLTDGEGLMNAYFAGPVKGPDGWFHVAWVWRDTGDCATNHDLSYARSSDLVHWETAAAAPLKLPIRLDEKTIVDPVPAGGGMINSNVRLSFDGQKRPVISYHKFDDKGFTQVYNARLEGSAWRIYQVSDWDWRWEFSGGGTIASQIGVEGVSPQGRGTLYQGYSHAKKGAGAWLLDEATMKPLRQAKRRQSVPTRVMKKRSEFEGMRVQVRGGSGSSGEPGVSYLLRWETLSSNRDQPRKPPLPEPSMLQLLKIQD
jgi:hypothetical protein